MEVTLRRTLGNWYYFMKPIHHIKNLLTLNACILLPSSSLVGCGNRCSEECFYNVGQRALRMSLWNQGGGAGARKTLESTDLDKIQ
jgi:hypothetical protein